MSVAIVTVTLMAVARAGPAVFEHCHSNIHSCLFYQSIATVLLPASTIPVRILCFLSVVLTIFVMSCNLAISVIAPLVRSYPGQGFQLAFATRTLRAWMMGR